MENRPLNKPPTLFLITLPAVSPIADAASLVAREAVWVAKYVATNAPIAISVSAFITLLLNV